MKMGTRKKETELVFNLQWKHKADNGDFKSNVIGMYDTPTTTSNFEMFKSYLLKNSGVVSNDVKVTYLTDNGQELVIDSQEWFEIALSAFRLKAKLGEVILLKLDKMVNAKYNSKRNSNTVGTQLNINPMDISEPPAWFITYMNQFKRDMVEEITYAVYSNLCGNTKDKENFIVLKKNKLESAKKHLVFGETPVSKEFSKTLKFDRKLDKLDAKTKRIKVKKQALINKIESREHGYFGKFSFISVNDDSKKKSVLGQQTEHEKHGERSRTNAIPDENIQNTGVTTSIEHIPLLNASFVDSANTFQNFIGGEIYVHTWEVINNGKLPWSSNTELLLTWGSADLKPSVKSLHCPSLKPGEKGSIRVCFEIPEKPGLYESNWNFYDNNVRFGHTLSLCVNVFQSIQYNTCKVTDNLKTIQAKCREETKMVCSMKESKLDNIPLLKNAEEQFHCLNAVNDPKISGVPSQWNKDILKTNEVKEEINPVQSESQAFNGTMSQDVERIFCPCGINNNESKQLEVPLKKSVEKVTSIQKLCSTNESTDLNNIGSELVISAETKKHNIQNTQFTCFTNTVDDESENTGVQFELLSQNNPQHVIEKEDFCVVGRSENSPKENILSVSDTILNLNQKIEKANLSETSHVDSDSDWESVFCGKSKSEKNFAINYMDGASNKYGISENDLIVDLSAGVKVELEKVENVMEFNKKGDKSTVDSHRNENNSNDDILYNNKPRKSISEVANVDLFKLSSDFQQVSVMDGKEDSSGYVYITIDGNKLPVSNHMLCPDFFADIKQSAVSPKLDMQRLASETKKNEIIESTCLQKSEPQNPTSHSNIEGLDIPDESFMSHCSAIGSCFSDTKSGRLFIFPQNHPGYEVIETIGKEDSTSFEDPQIYTWAKSETQYCLADLPNTYGLNSTLLKNDPHSPLEQRQQIPLHPPTPTFNHAPFEHISAPTHAVFSHPDGSSFCPNSEECCFSHCQQIYEFPPVSNYQQCINYQHHLTTTAPTPPQHPENSGSRSVPTVPTHILGENLVSGAVNVASSAINTARSVISMIMPPKQNPGRWVSGHWVTENPQSLRAKNLCILADMGFWDADLNATLLARYNDDLTRVVNELI